MASKVLIAIHWDKVQLLVARGQRMGGALWIDRTDVIELDANQGDAPNIAHHLKRLGITRGEATIVLPRSQVEMRQLNVPPVPVDELPELVRFQAQSQFATLTEEWALDYVPVTENGHVESVLATALSNKVIAQLKAAVEPAGIKVKHIVIRPFSTVELIRSKEIGKKNVLIINQFQTEIDLTVAVNGYVNLSRTIRVTPADDGTGDHQGYSENIVVQEARRTIASAMNQSSAVRIDSIIICGDRENHAELEELLKQQIQLPVSFFHPFQAIRVRPAAQQTLPARDGRFTPLIGSLVQQNSADNHAIDFLNPRKAIKTGDLKRKLILAGTLAAALLLAVSIYFYTAIQAKSREIARLKQENEQLIRENQGIESLIDEVAMIDDWTRLSIPWVEELRQVSERFLYPDEARTNQFQANIEQQTPTITLKGSSRDNDAWASLVEQLQDRPYVVNLGQGSEVIAEGVDMKFDYQVNLRLNTENQPLMVDQIREATSRDDPTSDETGQENMTSEPNDVDPTDLDDGKETHLDEEEVQDVG